MAKALKVFILLLNFLQEKLQVCFALGSVQAVVCRQSSGEATSCLQSKLKVGLRGGC